MVAVVVVVECVRGCRRGGGDGVGSCGGGVCAECHLPHRAVPPRGSLRSLPVPSLRCHPPPQPITLVSAINYVWV